MNNWRLLLLAVVALLQPSGSFTESNLIDGRQECCDHRSNSATQESSFHGNYRKTTPEDRRLNSQPFREDRRLQVRSRERLAVERTETRITPDSTVRINTEPRFARDQDHRLRSLDARDSRHTRDNLSRRTREDISRNSLYRYERDALDSRRVRVARDHARIGRDATRNVRDSEDYRRESTIRETATSQQRNDVARDEIRRDTRIDTSRFVNRVQDSNERGSFDRRARENAGETRRTSRSMESREDNLHMENRRSNVNRDISERFDDGRRENRHRTINQRDSSERIATNRRAEIRNSIEREDSRMEVRENRIHRRINGNSIHRDESRLSRERSLELRETRLNTERKLSRDTRILDKKTRLASSSDRTETRRVAKDFERSTRERINERRHKSEATETTRVLKTERNDDIREDRRQPLTRSLDREATQSSVSRSHNREARTSVRFVTGINVISNRRHVRSAERLDERKESRMSGERQTGGLRESRYNSERRQDSQRIVSPTRVEINVRPERESRIREIRDYIRSDLYRRDRSRNQPINRMTRDTERSHDSLLARNSRSADRVNNLLPSNRMRDDIRRERTDVSRRENDANRERVERLESRRTSRMQRVNSLEDMRVKKLDNREREESRVSRARVSQMRERAENQRQEVRETRESRIDARYELIRNRGARMDGFEARNKDENRSRDRVLQARSILAAKLVERRAREGPRDFEGRAERLSMSHDERRHNERDVRNFRDLKSVESRRENRIERQEQLNRRSSAVHRVANRENRDVRIEAKLRSNDNRREIDTRFRNFEAKVRGADAIEETYDNENTMSWQMVFYTLQGAYLCGLLLQLLNEKTNKGKSGKLTWWSSAKDLVKVD